jgi:hypothetical protein|tara:strand:+ start:1542 stop:1892 length:351 start_codon:yes stop_codon:yes gene_type:complete
MDTTTKTLLLISVGYIIYRYYKNWKEYNAEQAELTWPRKIQPCPDYWVKTNNGKCKNMFNIGKCPQTRGTRGQKMVPQGEINFNTSYYNGKDGQMNKCRWAQRCGNSWEGIDKLCA